MNCETKWVRESNPAEVSGDIVLLSGGVRHREVARLRTSLKPSKKECECGRRRAVSTCRGRRKFRKDHPLCKECRRGVVNSIRGVTGSHVIAKQG